LSLYQPTHRHHPDNQQDPIRFRNLVKTVEQSLKKTSSGREFEDLLGPFRNLADDSGFWNCTLEGLAVLRSPDLFRVYRLQRPVPELAVVADSFHTKPLLRIVQSADRYQVLGVNRQEIRLFEGNRDALDEIDPAPGVPRTITQALGAELTEAHLTVASYGTGAAGPAMRHGHGSRKEEIPIDTERFFRAVDRAVLEHHSRPSRLPLILAALAENQSAFRAMSQNPFLIEQGVDTHPDALSASALRERVWRILEPRYLTRLAGLVEQFGLGRQQALASDDPAQVAASAVMGRVGTILIDAERKMPGHIDPRSGAIADGDLNDPEIDDLLDDLGELVLEKGGQVVIVPSERMPTRTGLAAIYRY
jgi:hypothetical protein